MREARAAFERGDLSAEELVTATLERIQAGNPVVNAYTAITHARALQEARALDAGRRQGESLPPLAGLVYAVKNLFDVAGLTTLAGAALLARRPAAQSDAALVRRLAAQGAVLTGALNMDAYAYGFTTENTHYGVTRNPHDLTRVAGGSSGGSGAAIAAGMVPVTLGSDTNGSIRVPSSFCGTFGLKPTYGRLSRAGSEPFVPGLDHVGPLADSVAELALVYDALQGHDSDDQACAERPVEPCLPTLQAGVEGLRIGVLGGHFAQWADADARYAVQRVAALLEASDEVELPHADLARSAAFIITASEGGNAYLGELRQHPELFEPLSRDRLTAGALLPAAWYLQAQRFRRWFQQAVAEVFSRYDLLLAPATPCVATAIGAESMVINGTSLPVRPSIGLLTQPVSFIGLPVAVVPVWTASAMPIGVQLIAAPWRESLCLRAARVLEAEGLAECRVVQG